MAAIRGGCGDEDDGGCELALNIAMRLNPIGLVVTALIALGTALVVAYKRSATFRKIVDGAF